MISKRMVNHHAKSECFAYRGAAILRTSLLTDKNARPAPHKKREECGNLKIQARPARFTFNGGVIG
jgi:hypothetical protein